VFALPPQDENEEMGRELAEGKVHELERRAALAKGFADDLRRAYASLEDHAHTLDRENEDLQVPFRALNQLRLGMRLPELASGHVAVMS
jgi:WTAP/Mum2p family